MFRYPIVSNNPLFFLFKTQMALKSYNMRYIFLENVKKLIEHNRFSKHPVGAHALPHKDGRRVLATYYPSTQAIRLRIWRRAPLPGRGRLRRNPRNALRHFPGAVPRGIRPGTLLRSLTPRTRHKRHTLLNSLSNVRFVFF